MVDFNQSFDGRGVPQNLEAERSVLGALLLHSDAVADVTFLKPEDFYLPRHQVIFASIVSSFNGRHATDPLVVADELSRAGRLQDAGGHAQLLDLMECVVTAAGVAEHARLVLERSQQRRIAEVCTEIARCAYDNEGAADELRERMRSVADHATRQDAGGKTLLDLVREMRDEGPRVHVATGFAVLDSMLAGGFVFGDVHTLNGAPSSCKTLVVAQFGEVLNASGVLVAFHCSDERDLDIATRLFQRAGFRRSEVETRSPEDLTRMERAAAGSSLLFFDGEGSIEHVFAAVAREAKRQGRRPCIVIDSLQSVTSTAESRNASEHERLTERLRSIRNLARRHRVLALLTSEVSRGAYKSRNPADRVSDLSAGKGSGAIEYYSRFLANLENVPGESDVLELRVAKNKLGVGAIHREGESGVFLRVYRDEQRVEEAPDYVRGADQGDRAAAASRRASIDAAALAQILVESAGIAKRDAEMKLRGKVGCGSDRAAAAFAELRVAIAEVPGSRGRLSLFLDGSKVPAAIASAVPAELLSSILGARPPDVPRAAPSCPEDREGSTARAAPRPLRSRAGAGPLCPSPQGTPGAERAGAAQVICDSEARQ